MYHPRRQNYLFGTCETTTSSEIPMQEYHFFVTQFDNNIHLYYCNRKNLNIICSSKSICAV